MARFRSVTIVGVGLIGGSIGLALRARGLADKVIGVGSRASTLEAAKKLAAITDIAPDLPAAVAEADFVVVCAPVDHIVESVKKLAPHCRPGTLVTDAGSTKLDIVTALARAGQKSWPASVAFIGSHPLAGNEKKGPQHASADLFADRVVVITPTSDTRGEDLARLSDFWTALGAQVVHMPADEHDRALAATSHLPHLVASALAAATPAKHLALTAGGWQDTTRIAAGDPTLWRQILLTNRANVLASLDDLTARLTAWRTALEAGDATELERLLSEGKRIRDAAGN
jgi:prephenate dehydrogenase